MAQLSSETLTRLNTLNRWLSEVYRSDTRISTLLEQDGLLPEQVEQLKNGDLAGFIEAVLAYICAYPAHGGRQRSHEMMIEHYGLSGGRKRTFQEIGDEHDLTRERIRQLVSKRMKYFRSAKQKQSMKREIADIARSFLGLEPIITDINPVRSGEPWSLEEENRLLGLVQQDKDLDDIALTLQRETSDIRSHLKKLVDDGLSDKTTAKIVTLIERQQKGRPERHGSAWSSAEQNRLLELYRSGLSVAEIADALERTHGAIHSRITAIRNNMLGAARFLGLHPQDQQPIAIFPSPEDGPVVMWGAKIILVPPNFDLKIFSLVEALELLNSY